MFQLESIKKLFSPNLYWRNPYNVLQLSVYAAPKDIRKKKEDLDATSFCGNVRDSYSRLLPYGWEISSEVTDELFETLKSPESRLFYWLLWFWPLETGARGIDESIQYLNQCDASDRIGGLSSWYEYYLSDGREKDFISNHNLAVYYHMMALEQEHYRLLGEDIDLAKCDKLWKSAIKHFDRLLNNDDFWEFFAARVDDLNDPQITTEMVSLIRRDLPLGLDQINAALLKEYLCKNEFEDGKRQLEYIKSSQQGWDDVDGTLAELVNAMFKKFGVYCESIRNQVQAEKSRGAIIATNVLRRAPRRLQCLSLIAGKDSPDYSRMSDEIAYLVLECQIAYVRETGDWALSANLLQQALPFTKSEHAKKRLAQNLATVRSYVDGAKIDRFFAKWNVLDDADNVEDNPDDGLQIAKQLLRDARTIISEANELEVSSESFDRTAFADGLANRIQGCLIAYANKTGDYAACLPIQVQCEQVAVSEEIKVKIREGVRIIRGNIARDEADKLYAGIAKLLETEMANAKREPMSGGVRANKLIEDLSRKITSLEALNRDGASVKIDDIRDSYAVAAISCQVQYANLTEDWDATIEFLSKLKSMVNTEKMRQRINQNLKIVKANSDKKKLHETCWICKRRKADPASDQIITMHGDIGWEKDEQGKQKRMTWRVVDVHVPHCRECRSSEDLRLTQLKKDSHRKSSQRSDLMFGFHPFMKKETRKEKQNLLENELKEINAQIKEITERRSFPEVAEWLDKQYTHGPEPVPAGHFSDGTPLGWR